MVEVGIYRTRSDAEFAQVALEGSGIASILAADDAGGAYPFDLSGSGVRVLVEDTDAKDAVAILGTDR